MKLRNSLIVLGLACVATAASAQFMVTVTSNQPIVIGPLVPPKTPLGLNQSAGKTVINTSLQTPAAVKKNRQPDVKIQNPNYVIDCYEKTPGVCDRIVLLLEQYGGR